MKRLLILILSYIVISFSANQAFAATAPDAPTNPIATAVSSTQINIIWTAPTNDGGANISGYKIEYRIGASSYSILVANTGSTTTNYSHTGLTTGTQYTYKISAINSVGTGPTSSETSATPTSSSTGTNPGAPTGLTAVPASPTQVNLDWLPPANTGGYPISGYRIEYRVGSSAYTALDPNTGTTSTHYSHNGLTTNQVYVYRVYAITSFGTSQNPSSEAVAQPTSSSALTAPAAPTNLLASAVSPTQINLSWSAPANNGGSAITGYKIEAKSGSGSYSIIVSNTGNSAAAYSHTGVSTGTTYTYRVSAINSVGTSSGSGEASATPTSSSSSGVPSSPTGLVATAISGAQINLSWSAPANNGGYAITGYKIEYHVGSNSYTVLVANTGTTATSYSHTGLTSGQSYVYRVSAINSVGTSSVSGEASATPATSSSVPSAPTGLSATSASSTQINLSWGAPTNNGGSAITGYKIESKKGAGNFEILVANSQSTATSFSHTGLTAGTTYYYRVSAINSVGTGSSSETSTVPKETTSPAVTATAISPTAITLTWVPPSQTYKQSITGYKVEEKIAQDAYKVITEDISQTSYTISGLTTGKTYTYVVSAYFTLGASPRSNEATATPLTTSNASPPSQQASTIPNPPTNVIATPVSPTQINLSWSPPANTGGSSITGYKIEVKAGPAQFQTLTSSTQNTTAKYSHTKLVTGTPYVYRLYTITSSGISLASSEASATPTSTTIQTPPPTNANPPAPPTLSANLASTSQINLYWTTPANNGGSPITGYKIVYKIGSDPYRTLTSKTSSTTYSHTGLLANTYSYKVYAINAAGSSIASNEVTLTTVKTPLPEPTKCGTGTIFDEETQTCVVKQADPEPEPSVDPEPEETHTPKTTHIPGFPDPNKDPQYYVDRYNHESTYKAWFDRNFPGQTIYEVVGASEPEPPVPQELQCGTGTHLENGVCVIDEKKGGLLGGGCLIATAAYDTELAPQVQMLREIRDNALPRTSIGTTFMAEFNEFYYSFSPGVADLERQNPAFKELVKITITPMLSTLSLLNYADVNSEQQILGYGIGITLLNAGMYLGAPAFAILFIRSKIRK